MSFKLPIALAACLKAILSLLLPLGILLLSILPPLILLFGASLNSDGKYPYPHPLITYTLPHPAIPFTEGLNVRLVYSNGNYKDLVTEAGAMEQLATSVIYRL